MISAEELETPRSPQEWETFVLAKYKAIKENPPERGKGLLRQGLYRNFDTEIKPLSIFCKSVYSENFKIQYLLGNQGYDAIVRDSDGNIIEKIELTFPHKAEQVYRNGVLMVERGFGEYDCYDTGENLDRQFENIMKTCRKKSMKDYSDCVLAVAIDFQFPHEESNDIYEEKINELINGIQNIKFSAKKIYLIVLPLERVLSVN